MNKPIKSVRVEMIQDVVSSRGTLNSGMVFTAELLGRGSNWTKVKLVPLGLVKTLFNFEAHCTPLS